MAPLEMVGFRDELAENFTDLNLAWLKKYFTVEPIDREMLSRPKEYIIDKGGYIFFALTEDKVVGTFAFIRINDTTYELSKMAVEQAFQGRQVGNSMMKFCIEQARYLKIHKLILYSNTTLQPAIHLYKKYGFKEVPLDNSNYARSDIKMEIDLNTSDHEPDSTTVLR